jgi:uncharacterized protein (DUF433 family)
MDNKFNRIIREPLVMGGQARIRDTNITVNEIVRLSLDGTSQADILAKYPELKAEDVHQALSHTLQSIFDATHSSFFYDAKERLIPIEGLATLFEKQASELQIKSQVILRESKQLTARIESYRLWMQMMKGNFEPSELLGERQLEYVVEDIDIQLKKFGIRIPIEFPKHYANFKLDDIWTDILFQILSLLIPHIMKFEKVVIQPQQEVVLMQVISEDQYSGYVRLQRDWVNFPGTHLNTVATFAERNGIKFDIQQEGNRVIFEFVLPIWKDEQD